MLTKHTHFAPPRCWRSRPFPRHAQDAVDLAKAKAEGKVSWYTSTPIEQAQKIVGAFKQQTGIEVELFRSGGSAILQPLPAGDDGRPGRHRRADPFRSGRRPMRSPRKASSSPFKPKNFDKIPDAAKDADGQWVGQRLNLMTHYSAHRQGRAPPTSRRPGTTSSTPNTRASW